MPDWNINECFQIRILQIRISGVFGPASSFIQAISDTLVLELIASGFFQVMVVVCKDGHHGGILITSKSRAIVPIDYCTARKDSSQAVGVECNGQMFPMDKVGGNSMSPVQRSPNIAVGMIAENYAACSHMQYYISDLILPVIMSMIRLTTAEDVPEAGQVPDPFNSEMIDWIWGICICSGCMVAMISW